MKLFSNKSVFFILILAMMVLSGWFGYNAFISYKAYVDSQANTKGSVFVENIDEFINTLEEEELNSAIYFGSNGINNFNKLKQIRVEVDNTLNQLISKLQNLKDIK